MAFIGQPLPSSTALQGAAYDQGRKMLYVTFIQGQTYLYLNVEPQEVQDLINAVNDGSVGRTFYYGIREDHVGYKMG